MRRKPSNRFRAAVFCGLISTLAIGPLGAVTTADAHAGWSQQDEVTLPPGWKQTGAVDVPPNQLKSFSAKLGGEITAVRNTIYRANGVTFRVNHIRCRDEKQAAAVFESLKKIKSEGVKLDGATIIELTCNDNAVASRALTVSSPAWSSESPTRFPNR